MMNAEKTLFFKHALLSDGWAERVRLSVTASGDIGEIATGSEPDGAEILGDAAIPGMPNVHSHAFQRSLAGLAESRTHPSDSFWSWRNTMYAFISHLTPEQLQAIAAQLYMEMLKAGYTSVAEFHYLHHDPSGVPYSSPSLLSDAILSAALSAGIGITHLPVLYMSSDFGNQPPNPAQRRFVHTTDKFMDLYAALLAKYQTQPQIRFGLALHSLRAVPEYALHQVVSAITESQPNTPVHIHIAEQTKEVNDCLAHSGQRPVEWLLDHAKVDQHWNLVHATHLTASERDSLANSKAVAGLCPTTEANLGDGFFPLEPFLQSGGRFGIGSDSNSSVSPIEELRWLEYGQRLVHRQRNIVSSMAQPDVALNLWTRSCVGGAQALGQSTGQIKTGYRADLLVLDRQHPNLVARRTDELLASFIFSGNTNPISHVIAGGKHVVIAGQHCDEEEIARQFRTAMKEIAEHAT